MHSKREKEKKKDGRRGGRLLTVLTDDHTGDVGLLVKIAVPFPEPLKVLHIYFPQAERYHCVVPSLPGWHYQQKDPTDKAHHLGDSGHFEWSFKIAVRRVLKTREGKKGSVLSREAVTSGMSIRQVHAVYKHYRREEQNACQTITTHSTSSPCM